MRKILRNKGQSITKLAIEDEAITNKSLRRGLRKKSTQALVIENSQYREIFDLQTLLKSDSTLLFRQTISLLDKIVKKPRGNDRKNFHLQAYVDRALLAEEIWKIYQLHFEDELLVDNDTSKIEDLMAQWRGKVHPYARKGHEVTSTPQNDQNAKFISDHGDKTLTRDDFKGRWHDAFWKSNDDGTTDFRGIAEAVWSHLLVSEKKISGQPRLLKDKPPTGMAAARGQRISSSVRDPRTERNQNKFRDTDWDAASEELYFRNDIATEILNRIRQSDEEKIFPSFAGKLLHEHFGKILRGPFSSLSEDERHRLWSLHNQTRTYYQKLLKSERFRRAGVNENEDRTRYLPRDRDVLLDRLKGRKESSDIAELIRLGKLVVHAADLPRDTEPGDIGEAFETRMAHLATSEGQHLIKRNEAFTRVWRNAVGVSLRSLTVWSSINDEDNMDISGAQKSAEALRSLFSKGDSRYADHAAILFGLEPFPDRKGGRASIFTDGDLRTKKERFWTLLRIAAELRNRTNHFSTRDRLLDLLQDGIVEFVDDSQLDNNFFGRSGAVVARSSLSALRDLLDLDRSIVSETRARDLNGVGFGAFTPADQRQKLIDELGKSGGNSSVTYPSWKAVLRRLHDLADNDDEQLHPILQSISLLKVGAEASVGADISQYRGGVISLLYQTGFRKWLEEESSESIDIRKIVTGIAERQSIRGQKWQEDQGRMYVHAESLADRVGITQVEDLDSLLSELASQTIIEEGLNLQYRPNRKRQGNFSNRIERFKQEIFAYLFAGYVHSRELAWLFDELEVGEGTDVQARELDISIGPFAERWHAVIYAWLYTVPLDDISRLRQQVRKSRLLEAKSADTAPDQQQERAMQDLDDLMGLYVEVQGTGFSGVEHFNLGEAGKLFYANPGLFNKAFSTLQEHHQYSYRGTRRGLRQMIRLGDLDTLRRIVEKHRVLDCETDALMNAERADIQALFSQRQDRHRAIVKALKQERSDPKTREDIATELVGLCRDYETAASKAALHNFGVAAARLTDFSRLHQILMRVVGRLVDYTLLWERDMKYLYLGLLYRQHQTSGVRLTAVSMEPEGKPGRRRRIGLQLPVGDNTTLALWDEGRGFCLPNFNQIHDLLTPENRMTHSRYFHGTEVHNPKDAKLLGIRATHPPTVHKGPGYWRIRNDFAHYNILNPKRGRLNLTYRINAVRSMFGYDRKLKNAVSGSIQHILNDEGLSIDWILRQDRLRSAHVTPMLEYHLKMVPASLVPDARFAIPRASVRLTSMVQGLFTFETGGHRAEEEINGEMKRNGTLGYPDFPGDEDVRIPEVVWKVKMPRL